MITETQKQEFLEAAAMLEACDMHDAAQDLHERLLDEIAPPPTKSEYVFRRKQHGRSTPQSI